jgi:hypothetical protein
MDKMVLRRFAPRVELRRGSREEAWSAQSNGHNDLFGFWIWSDIDNRAGTGAQELYEWSWTWKWKLALMAVAGLLSGAGLWFVGAPIWLAIVPALFASLLVQIHPLQRRKELVSHEIETQVAVQFDGVNAGDYRRREIGSPSTGGMATYPWLKDMRPDLIEMAMREATPKAQAWIRRHDSIIQKLYDFRWPS